MCGDPDDYFSSPYFLSFEHDRKRDSVAKSANPPI